MKSWEEYEKEHSKFYLSQKLEMVSREEYYEQLNMLPPYMWKSSGDSFSGKVEYFMCSEFTFGNITRQYYCSNGYYYKKYVDIKDQSTWISQTDIYYFKRFLNALYDSYIFAMKILVREDAFTEMNNHRLAYEGLCIHAEIAYEFY